MKSSQQNTTGGCNGLSCLFQGVLTRHMWAGELAAGRPNASTFSQSVQTLLALLSDSLSPHCLWCCHCAELRGRLWLLRTRSAAPLRIEKLRIFWCPCHPQLLSLTSVFPLTISEIKTALCVVECLPADKVESYHLSFAFVLTFQDFHDVNFSCICIIGNSKERLLITILLAPTCII